MDIVSHLTRQAAFSKATFGPGPRTKGVSDHIKKELVEIEVASTDAERSDEWTDVAILGLDGLLRSIAAANPTWHYDRVAMEAWVRIQNKQGVNELRDWPDWRKAPVDSAIEHVRTADEAFRKRGEDETFKR